jgi:predicted dehydrogenase
MMGVAVLGTGWIANEHIKAFQKNPHTEVRGILSRELARAKAKIAEYGLHDCRPATDLADLLKDDSIQIVSIGTPHHLHTPQAIQSAESGRHILVEKPMSLSLADVRALDSAVRGARVKSLVSFVLRWNPLFENIKALLEQSLLGRVFLGEVDYLSTIGPSYGGHTWIRQKQFGGNNLLTAGCHAVDALRWFIGQKVVEVFSYANRSPANPCGIEYDTNSLTLLQFENGTIGKVGCTIEGRLPYTFPITLLGEAGTIRNNQIYTQRWPGQTDWATIPTILPDTAEVTHHPFVGEIDHFVDCIVNDRESHCNVTDAVETHEICLAAEISACERRPVRLPLG